MRRLSLITIVVRDYDVAIRYYTSTLDFTLVENTDRGQGKRWVRMNVGEGSEILLAEAVGPEQGSRIGNQTGGRVAFFLETEDFDRDFDLFKRRGVTFLEAPRREPYGSVAKFVDLYGNLWDLIQNNRIDS